MSKLDKFKGRSGSSSSSVDLEKSYNRDQLPSPGKALGMRTGTVERILGKRSGRFVFALDATGSMAPLIEMAKSSLRNIMLSIFKEAGLQVELQLFVYRDYDVPQRIVEQSPLSSNAEPLLSWLAHVDATGGGSDEGEAIEVVLARIAEHKEIDAVLLAGDEPSHHRQDLRVHGKGNSPTAQDIAVRYKERNTPIHTFVVGDDSRTIRDFAKIAALSGGRSGRLDGSSSMKDMAVLAMLSSLKGRGAIQDYMNRNELTPNAREFGKLLLTPPRS